jgi:potassium-transporting ATPase KdpC subunit
MFKQIKSAFLIFLILTVITGIVYPFIITTIAQMFFPHQANGSLIIKNGKAIGSYLIGQEFNDPKYFWSRPSAIASIPYNGAISSGSNIGPANILLKQNIEIYIKKFKDADPDNTKALPIDLVTSSASGLDPHISVEGALYQVKRVAHARGLEEKEIIKLIHKNTQKRFLGIIGEPIVNVLILNIELDERS